MLAFELCLLSKRRQVHCHRRKQFHITLEAKSTRGEMQREVQPPGLTRSLNLWFNMLRFSETLAGLLPTFSRLVSTLLTSGPIGTYLRHGLDLEPIRVSGAVFMRSRPKCEHVRCQGQSSGHERSCGIDTNRPMVPTF
ncbi:hypothetical protein BDN72DRAFT_617328 [Pluteus cervinus]|uniref:Uncharacterized protein n=1 Tax=Pluteus cervinus TaxID=181527 RepID=A0ACD3A1D2_9AGAR|nr:hypothetical protein BDN72DRAFT_617328 [Pluteus cervinus]